MQAICKGERLDGAGLEEEQCNTHQESQAPHPKKRKTVLHLLSSSDDEPEPGAVVEPQKKMKGEELFPSTKEVLRIICADL